MATQPPAGNYSGKPTELYYRFMTPAFLGNNANWDCDFEVKQDLQLIIKPDNNDYERIFSLSLLDGKTPQLKSNSDLTVKIRVGLEYTGGTPPDPISFTISDKRKAFGYQFLDRTTYHQNGPYYPIHGNSGHYDFNPPTIHTDKKQPCKETEWPRVFEMRLKPVTYSQRGSPFGFGSCYCAIDGGHMISCDFPELDPSRGLWLEAYRGDDKEHYIINYVEVTITETQP